MKVIMQTDKGFFEEIVVYGKMNFTLKAVV
jgi:hypothetical protein